MNKLLENVRTIRESKGYSQEDVAEMIKTSQPKYARFERGATKTDLEFLEQVAKVFNMSLIDIIAYPVKMVDANSINTSLNNDIKAVLQIELKKEKKEQVLKLVFGENNLEILNK
jgi:transcriptional regulator with XRE-family HTH domain